MNAAHFHLFLSHISVIAIPILTVILAYSHFTKNAAMLRFLSGLIILLSLIAIPSYLTGQPAADLIEDFPSMKEELFESHQEISLISFVISCITAVLSAAVIVFTNKPNLQKILTRILLLILVIQTAALYFTAISGVRIRHTEVRNIQQNFNQ